MTNEVAIVEYKDVVLKTSYYKEIVIKELAKYGLEINNEKIEERLNLIDRYLAIFSTTTRFPEDQFDAPLFTKEMAEIHQDLKFLYELLYELAVVEFEDIRSFADAHLREVEKKTREYKARVDIETNSSFIGETVFYMDGPFPWFTKDNYLFTELGEAEIKPGSKIAFLVSGHDLSDKNISLGIKHGENIFYVQPYNHGYDTFTMEGSSISNSYEITINEELSLSDTFELTPEKMTPKENSSYIAYCGKNKILTTQDREREHIAQEDGYSFFVKGNWEVSFYICGGTYAKFEFSKKIENKNFEGAEIRSLDSVHRIRMRDEGEFGFSIKTDGIIFAEQTVVYAQDGKLIHYQGSLSNDFVIEEYTSADAEVYELFLRIMSDTEEYPVIDSVAIKELLEADVIVNDLL